MTGPEDKHPSKRFDAYGNALSSRGLPITPWNLEQKDSSNIVSSTAKKDIAKYIPYISKIISLGTGSIYGIEDIKKNLVDMVVKIIPQVF